MVSITEANQDFSKVARLADELGSVVILKNNVLRYLVIDFSKADEQKLVVCEEMMGMQVAFFEELGMKDIAAHCVRLMEDYRKEIGIRLRK